MFQLWSKESVLCLERPAKYRVVNNSASQKENGKRLKFNLEIANYIIWHFSHSKKSRTWFWHTHTRVCVRVQCVCKREKECTQVRNWSLTMIDEGKHLSHFLSFSQIVPVVWDHELWELFHHRDNKHFGLEIHYTRFLMEFDMQDM